MLESITEHDVVTMLAILLLQPIMHSGRVCGGRRGRGVTFFADETVVLCSHDTPVRTVLGNRSRVFDPRCRTGE